MLDYIDMRAKIRKNNVFAGSEHVARDFFSQGITPIIWSYSLAVSFHKKGFKRFDIPAQRIFFMDMSNIYSVKILKNGNLSLNNERVSIETKFFDSEEECFKQFEIDFKKAKDKINKELETAVFKKFKQAEKLLRGI